MHFVSLLTHRCLKKYCVCFNAGVECSAGRCKCNDCKNPHGAVSQFSSNRVSKVAQVGGAEEVLPQSQRTTENTKCSCTRTKCLKLYCECFRNDLVCTDNCECLDCKNTIEESEPGGERYDAREQMLKARPNVFKTVKKKVGVGCSCTRNK